MCALDSCTLDSCRRVGRFQLPHGLFSGGCVSCAVSKLIFLGASLCSGSIRRNRFCSGAPGAPVVASDRSCRARGVAGSGLVIRGGEEGSSDVTVASVATWDVPRDCPYSRDFRGDFCVSRGLEKSRSVHVATIACAPGAQGGRSYGIQQPGSMFGRPGSIQVEQTLAQSLRHRGSVPLCSGRAWAASRRAAGAELRRKLRRRRHVSTFALTWRDYCLWRSASTHSTFAGEAPRLYGQSLSHACHRPQTPPPSAPFTHLEQPPQIASALAGCPSPPGTRWMAGICLL